MNKILVIIFNDEPTGYKGLSALRDLHNEGDISLYAAAIIQKDPSGAISVKEAADEGPVGTAIGMLTGSIAGLLGGPAGVAIGASLGGLTGLLFDLWDTGINIDFIDEALNNLTPGKVAIIADIEETWITPVDTKIGELGGQTYRRLRSEVIEDQLAREYAAFKAELNLLETELEQATAENKAAIQKHIDTVKQKIKATQEQAEARVKKLRTDTEAKISSLQGQMKHAADKKKAKIEKRITDVKADYNARSAKLKQAQVLIKEALFA